VLTLRASVLPTTRENFSLSASGSGWTNNQSPPLVACGTHTGPPATYGALGNTHSFYPDLWPALSLIVGPGGTTFALGPALVPGLAGGALGLDYWICVVEGFGAGDTVLATSGPFTVVN